MSITMQSDTLIHQRVEQARRGINPTVIGRVRSGWAVLGDQQFLPGYSLLLPDPVVSSINDLQDEQRACFLADMTALGDALLASTDACRINYGIYGNLEPALHAHVFARYADEPGAFRTAPPWQYPQEQRDSRPFDRERDRPLMEAIRRWLVIHGSALETT